MRGAGGEGGRSGCPYDGPWWKSLLFASLLIAAAFALVEVLLRLAGVAPLLEERDPFEGFSRQVRVFEPDARRGVLATPPRALERSFYYQEFRARKPPGGFRIFVLGGSSAAGFPYGASLAFGRVLGDALQASWPQRAVEAVNASAMSYASHRLRILAHEVIAYEPDAIVVYEGHNEFVERRFYRDLLGRREGLDPLRRLLYRWRLYGSMVRLAAIAGGSGERAERREEATAGESLGLDVVREDAAGTLREDKERVRGLFEENLRAIVRLAEQAGARAALCTVPSNLRDWPPNQSLFDPALGSEARERALSLLARGRDLLEAGDAASVAALVEAARIAGEHAEIQFRLARAYETFGRWEEARVAYGRARDADAQPSRAPGPFNETIRKVASEEGALLVDVERAFEAASPHGLVGFNLIDDYVHPTPRGHRLIALEIWRSFTEAGLPGPPGRADDAAFWRIVGEAPEGEAAIAAAAGTPEEARSRTAEWIYNQGVVLEQHGLEDQAVEKYRASIHLQPLFHPAAFNLGRLLHQRGRSDLAASLFRQALAAKPDHVKSMLGLAMTQVRLENPGEAERTLRRAIEVDPASADAWNALGHACVLQRKPACALPSFRKAVELDPRHAEALCNLAAALLRRGGAREAIRRFRAALAVRHDMRRARNGLADALASEGELEEAERLYEESLRVDPDDLRAVAGLAALRTRRGPARPEPESEAP